MQQDPSLPDGLSAPEPLRGATAGEMLRDTREAAGLSIDAVAQQLKLAPRQVKALEDAEFDLLPGRTFVRGFARSYARLLGLDPQVVLNALPGSAAGGLEVPPLHPTSVTMGELPSAGKAVPGWVRWGIPLVLVAIVIAAAGYALVHGDLRRAMSPTAVQPVTPAQPGGSPVTLPSSDTSAAPGPAVASVAAPSPTPTPPAPGDTTATLLPNPTLGPPLETGTAPPPGTPAGGDVTGGNPASGAHATQDAASIAPIALTLRGASWIEVKDGSGNVLLAQTIAAGQTQSIVGTPPFVIVIGNAQGVSLRFRGAPVDLAPYTRGNVARLKLQ